MITKDNPGTLPINLYPADAMTIQPLDFAVLSEAAADPVRCIRKQQRPSKIVCVKADSSDTHQQFMMACLQENVSVRMKMVKVNVFIQDHFDPVMFTEDAERYGDVSNFVCALTCYNYCEDILGLEEDDVIPGGVLPIMAYTGRLRPKGVPFLPKWYMKG